ncbi:MAG: EAL domain-containing protein [Rhizobacter sp.]|jgi:predicted signal transduction protein with EAL and GGDEF domain/DNA-binding response OmpR family regulator|nr:EAL domain-containing protein [Burkholderiaceae bacterium]MCO5123132.1 EAL domain-containing protein [Rhizobacter sp.]
MKRAEALAGEGEPAHKVLLVDDDDVNLLLTSHALREAGFEVTEVTSGEGALDLLDSFVPDIVVLDALMPGLDGFQTCRVLRGRSGFDALPVLMLTGLDDDASITRAYEAGATDFFVKSTQWSLLTGRLRHLLRSAGIRIELERSKAKLARAQDLARMGSFDWRRGHGGPVFSVEGLRVLGLPSDAKFGIRQMLRTVNDDVRAGLIELLHDALRHSLALATDVPVTLHDHKQRIIHLEAEPEFNEHGHLSGYTGIVQDVTDRRLDEDKIRHLANFDTLTGLPNRHQLNLRAESALEHARRLGHQVGVLLIDLGRFKVINDTLGHAAGDELLMEVGRRLRSSVRHSDKEIEVSIDSMGSRSHRALEGVGRYGGDEFVALLPEIGDELDAERVASRILELLKDPMFVGGQECFVTASVGIALFPRDGASVADLMRSADVAMYAAKAQGPNTHALYSPHLAGMGRAKIELESALHKAIERNELVLHYQPKVDARSVRMIGVEALMRWNRNGVLVPPGDFIPLAEETGLIVPLSEWAIREAARQTRVWQDRFGFSDSIAVNLPNRLFERTDLIEHIHAAVTMHGVPHHAIQLEITETGLMKDSGNVNMTLHRLNEMGVEISIDDFGTGYSSLSYITNMPISELKIDRAFVHNLGLTPQSSAIVTAIIAIARSLGLRVVAEGVETLRQMEQLHRLGCRFMQGFLFSRPLAPDQLEAWREQTLLSRNAPWIAEASDAASDGQGREPHLRAANTIPRA